jgi:hypothetical protein
MYALYPKLLQLLNRSVSSGSHLAKSPQQLDCKEEPIYVFPEMKLRGLVPNFHIYASVSDLYIPTIGPSIFCSKIGRPIVGI